MPMDENTLAKLLSWRVDSLRPIAEDLKSKLKGLEKLHIQSFIELVNERSIKAVDEFKTAFGLNSAKDISLDLSVSYMTVVVAEFNSVIPQDFPYAIAIFVINLGASIRLGAIRKSKIPNIEKLSRNNFVPIINVVLGEGVDPSKPFKLNVTSAKYMGGTGPDVPEPFAKAGDIE